MKVIQIIFISIFLLLVLYACKSILERDISGDVVILNSPPDGMHSDNYTQTFWWEKVEGASTYNLQIVSPSFDYVEKLIVDTNISSTQFSYTFAPNSFTWRVKASNSAYFTDYSEASFVIDSTPKPQLVNLIRPSDNFASNESIITFEWAPSANATRYRMLITKNGNTFNDKEVNSTSLTYPDEGNSLPQLSDGVYSWQVRAENTLANSEYSSAWNLIVDLTAPELPQIIEPIKDDTISEFKISWKHPLVGGSQIKDSLIIYSDSVGNILYHEQYLTDTIYIQNSAPEKWYQYKVKSFDAAGNESGWTSLRRFYYKESTGN